VIAVVDHVSSCDGFTRYDTAVMARVALKRNPCRLWMRVTFCAGCGCYHVRRNWES
jgi:hypothetical protein